MPGDPGPFGLQEELIGRNLVQARQLREALEGDRALAALVAAERGWLEPAARPTLDLLERQATRFAGMSQHSPDDLGELLHSRGSLRREC